MKTKTFAKLMIVCALFLGIFALVRGFYYAPNKDSGLSIEAEQSETSTSTPSSSQSAAAVAAIGAIQSPTRLVIPKLEIDAKVQQVGVTKSGNMAAPNNFTDVSWYKFGTLPGNYGSAVIAGHQDNAVSLDGVFKHLEDLKLGDDIYVVGADGKRLHFRVVDKEIYPYDQAPLQRIFHADDKAYLVLITCAGKWLQSVKTNDKRLVVYTELVKD